MRSALTVVGLACLLALTGCESTRWNWLKRDQAPTPGGDGNTPSVASLVDYLNNNAGRIQSFRVEDLDLTCTQKMQSFGLRGQMVAQKPRSFRMGAKVTGKDVVDMGSNDQEFWYWISKSEPPHQFYCSYKDLQEGRVKGMPFPFQPEWVMETMGLGPYGPPEKYKMETDKESIRLVEKTTSPQGVPVRKVIVFKRRPVQAPNPQVTDYLLVDDASGKEICDAHITEVQIDRGTGAILPRRLELRWPSEQVKMAMKLDTVSVNAQLQQTVFVRQLMQGVQSFNLATMRPDNSPPPNSFTDNKRFDPGLKTIKGVQ